MRHIAEEIIVLAKLYTSLAMSVLIVVVPSLFLLGTNSISSHLFTIVASVICVTAITYFLLSRLSKRMSRDQFRIHDELKQRALIINHNSTREAQVASLAILRDLATKEGVEYVRSLEDHLKEMDLQSHGLSILSSIMPVLVLDEGERTIYIARDSERVDSAGRVVLEMSPDGNDYVLYASNGTVEWKSGELQLGFSSIWHWLLFELQSDILT